MQRSLLHRHGGRILTLVWLSLLSCLSALQAQCLCGMDPVPTSPGGTARNSCLGQAHTPHGHLHVLMIYIYYPGEDRATDFDLDDWPNDPTLPLIARDSGIGTPNIPGVTDLLTADTTTLLANLNYQNISQYYYKMSGGKFLLTGDVYEQQVHPSWYHRAPRGQAGRTAFARYGDDSPQQETTAYPIISIHRQPLSLTL